MLCITDQVNRILYLHRIMEVKNKKKSCYYLQSIMIVWSDDACTLYMRRCGVLRLVSIPKFYQFIIRSLLFWPYYKFHTFVKSFMMNRITGRISDMLTGSNMSGSLLGFGIPGNLTNGKSRESWSIPGIPRETRFFINKPTNIFVLCVGGIYFALSSFYEELY